MFYNENNAKACTCGKEICFERKENNADNQSSVVHNYQVPTYVVNFMGLGRVCDDYLD
jgi:hypothetical protein